MRALVDDSLEEIEKGKKQLLSVFEPKTFWLCGVSSTNVLQPVPDPMKKNLSAQIYATLIIKPSDWLRIVT